MRKRAVGMKATARVKPKHERTLIGVGLSGAVCPTIRDKTTLESFLHHNGVFDAYKDLVSVRQRSVSARVP